MKAKQITAVISACTLLSGMLCTVTVNAASNEQVYPTVGVHLRIKDGGYNGNNYHTLDVTNLSETAETAYEMQWGSGFAAVYKYDISEYINDTDVTVTVTTDDKAYSALIYTEIPQQGTNTDADKMYDFISANISSAYNAAANGIINLTWNDLINNKDDANNIYLVLTRNSNGKWSKCIDKSKTPYLTINSIPSVAEVGGTYYSSLNDALTNAENNSTVTLLNDVTLPSRLSISKNLTITSDNKTITGNTSPAAVLVNNGKSVTFENTNITDSDTSSDNALAVSNANSKVTVNGGTVTGNIYQENGTNTAVTLNNVIVNGNIHTRLGDSPNTGSTSAILHLTNSTVKGSITYNSSKDTYDAKNSTITGNVIDSNFSVATDDTISMVPSFLSSYEGTDSSTAVAYRAAFKNNSADEITFSLANVTWKYDGTLVQYVNDIDQSTKFTLENGSEVVYGVIISGKSENKSLTAEINSEQISIMNIENFDAEELEEDESFTFGDNTFEIYDDNADSMSETE